MAPDRRPASGRTPWFPIILVGIVVIAGGVWASSPLWRSTIGTKSSDDDTNVTFLVPPATHPAPPAHAVTDPPDPGALYRGTYPSNAQTRERRVGGPPAHFDGYAASVTSVASVPAASYTKGTPGSYLRVAVTVVNQGPASGQVCACDFSLWTRAGGLQKATNVSASNLGPASALRSGASRTGNVYLYIGTAKGPFFVVYQPHTTAMTAQPNGVWEAPK